MVEYRVRWLTLVRSDEIAVCGRKVFGRDDRHRTPAKQVGSVRSELGGEIIEPCDEVVVELDKNFTASHGPYGNTYGSAGAMSGSTVGQSACYQTAGFDLVDQAVPAVRGERS